ncbi:MAG: hypothetical protein ABI629_18280, partial [bacterium]
DIKVLCGDQVYLDQPSLEYQTHTHDAADLQRRFLDTYLRTWSPGAPSGGLAEILRDGANFFASDDHEFWNNAPEFATLIRDSHSAAGRQQWLAAARRVYDVFQSDAAVTIFDVGALSFCVLDTRVDRGEGLSQFMTSANLQRVQGWIAALRGPGVLVLGQPLFCKPSGTVVGTFVDFSLADYGQYGGLAAMVNQTAHDLVVLTGDVHFGRVAECRLLNGQRVVEVISSPLALVSELVGRAFEEAPPRFPARAIPGVPSAPVTTRAFRETRDHFLTLEFGADGHQVQLVVKNWVVGAPTGQASAVVYSTLLA